MESSVVLVQYQPFQFYSLLENNGEKTSTRFKRRTSHSKIATNDEPYMQGVPSNVSSSTSVSPGKISDGNQDPWSMNAEKEERPGEPVVGSDRKTASDYYHEQFIESSSSASYSKWDDNHAWSSQESKTDTEMCKRSGRPDVTSWGTTRESQPGFSHEETQHDGTAQSAVNDAILREKIGETRRWSSKRSKATTICHWKRWSRIRIVSGIKCYRRWKETFYIWEMFMTVTMESAVFMGKKYLNNCQSIANTTDLTLKQMFDISTRLVSEQDEISGLETIGWEKHSWKYLSLIRDERVINLQRTKVYVFSDSVLWSW